MTYVANAIPVTTIEDCSDLQTRVIRVRHNGNASMMNWMNNYI